MLLAISLLAARPASAQELAASFYARRPVYVVGEPVWFVFEVTNKGNVPVHIEDSNPYGVCALDGGYYFDVPGARTLDRWRCGYGGSCAGGGSKPLPPGATYTQRLLLNQWFVIDHPGKYHVSASRQLRFSGRVSSLGILLAPVSRSFKSEFEIAVVEGERAKVQRAFTPFLENLNSPEFELRVEAIETITAMASPFLEKTLIALANGPDSFAQGRAIPALGRLNTAESKRALAQLIEDRQPYYSWQAIDALAQTGDRSYVPLLAELARESAWQNVAIPALGELGGPGVVSSLVPLVRYPLGPPNEPPVQSLAIRGLASTGSPEAVPYLIEALRDPLVHQDAVNALEQLTHLVIWNQKSKHWLYAQDQATMERMAERWQRWWKLRGEKAKLYGPGDCTTWPEPLPEPSQP
jgi:HEAT repeat protein